MRILCQGSTIFFSILQSHLDLENYLGSELAASKQKNEAKHKTNLQLHNNSKVNLYL